MMVVINKVSIKEEQKKFAYKIDSLVANTGISYIDAILEYCEETGMEIELVTSLINANLKEKIAMQAMENHLVKTEFSMLPL